MKPDAPSIPASPSLLSRLRAMPREQAFMHLPELCLVGAASESKSGPSSRFLTPRLKTSLQQLDGRQKINCFFGKVQLPDSHV